MDRQILSKKRSLFLLDARCLKKFKNKLTARQQSCYEYKEQLTPFILRNSNYYAERNGENTGPFSLQAEEVSSSCRSCHTAKAEG